MTLAIILFVVGYLAIAFEHSLHVNKAASALLTGVFCWLCYYLSGAEVHQATETLGHHMGEIASILFFLIGAMTIVEIIDCYHGFDIITRQIKTTRKTQLLLIISSLTFFLSALLDNLTTAIVMTSLLQKLFSEKEDRLWFAGAVIIAANAGGAWSPLGDVTTTMLWIGGQITASSTIRSVLLPSLVACAVPLSILVLKFRGQRIVAMEKGRLGSPREGRIILASGISLLVFVPVFKTVTHMPPFMGMMLALGLMWIVVSVMHLKRSVEDEAPTKFSVNAALEKIDTPSILFFLGILLAVAALQSFGALRTMADFLQTTLGNDYAIGSVLGVISALVDNVPLVAGAQGMYDLSQYPTDHSFWRFLAFTTGTGGSAIIIGSSAGVAVMGIEKVSFGWYLKKISLLVLLGFAAGALVFIGQEALFPISHVVLPTALPPSLPVAPH